MRLLFFFLISPLLFCGQFTIGAGSGFGDVYFVTNISYYTASNGNKAVRLQDDRADPADDTDMLFHFDGNLADAAGRYTAAMTPGVAFTPDRVYTERALLFPRKGNGIRITGSDDSLLFATDRIGSMTISFHVKPAQTLTGADILSRTGSFIERGEVKREGIRAYIAQGKLHWEFNNIFRGTEPRSFVMHGETFLKPGVWHHHALRYEAPRGRLVMFCDGNEEVELYATDNGGKDGNVLLGSFSKDDHNPLVIGDGFTGALDELSIVATAVRRFAASRYTARAGMMLSSVKDLREEMLIEHIRCDSTEPGGSDVRLMYRVSGRYFLPDNATIPWVYIPQDAALSNVRGRYIQVKTELLAEPTRLYSPQVNSVTVRWRDDEPPLVPTGLLAQPQNSAVTLSWEAVPDRSIAGYKIYFGNERGYYDCGSSPLIVRGRVTNYTVSGLTNDMLYYFAVSAFDENGAVHESALSSEIYARPKPYLK